MGKAEKRGNAVIMEGKSILVFGPNTLQNELIASFLQKETSAKCVALDNDAELGSHHPAREAQNLILYDCMGDDVGDCMEHCAPLLEGKPGRPLLCFFNLKKDSGVEKSLLTEGVKGFFYRGESIQTLAKGVRAVLNGEFWVSRKILTDLIEKNNTGTKEVHQDILTRREIDILAMIVEGASNDAIAVKLCISKYTVKTHLYNIFKKLNVKSRFQAALWAAKHL